VDRVLGFVEPARLAPLRLLVNAGNGAAGPTADALLDALAAAGAPLSVARMHHAPDPTFPNGIPNPLLPENRPATSAAVRAREADLAVCWDGDFDRCFLFDGTGAFVAGEYIVGLLAAAILKSHPGGRIVHDPRVQWNTRRLVAGAGGTAIVSRTGHAPVKARMRTVDAVYGGEMSAHHYFRDFMYCDSGMIPWLLVLRRLSEAQTTLAAEIGDMRARHPSSGEINFRVADVAATIERVRDALADGARGIDMLDGLSLAFDDWRFNLRGASTEPLLRLNVEARGDPALVEAGVARIAALIEG